MSAYVLFSKKRGILPEPEIYLHQLPVKTEHKFLSVTFNLRLLFFPHLKHLKVKYLCAMTVPKVLAHTKWGADRKCLLHLFKSLVSLRLWMRGVWAASDAALRMLDPQSRLGLSAPVQ